MDVTIPISLENHSAAAVDSLFRCSDKLLRVRNGDVLASSFHKIWPGLPCKIGSKRIASVRSNWLLGGTRNVLCVIGSEGFAARYQFNAEQRRTTFHVSYKIESYGRGWRSFILNEVAELCSYSNIDTVQGSGVGD